MWCVKMEWEVIKVHNTFSKGMTSELDCGVVEWMKHGTLRWFVKVMRRNDDFKCMRAGLTGMMSEEDHL